VGSANLAPSAEHIFGTDSQGRDVFRLTVWGGRGTLLVGFGSGALITLVAVVIGAMSGYYRGLADNVLSLLTNLFLVIPGLPLLIILSAYLQPGTATIIAALAFTGWAFSARIIRAQTLSVREKEFVNASIVSGEKDGYIIFREILPNLTSVIASGFIGAVVYSIGAATGLSFLGLTSTNEVTWGTNIFWAQNGEALLSGAWWTFLPSGLAVALVAFGLSLINYGIDEVTNPRLRSEREMSNVVKHTGRRRVRATPFVPRAH
jgi:peptide/nickel transport system permease protein